MITKDVWKAVLIVNKTIFMVGTLFQPRSLSKTVNESNNSLPVSGSWTEFMLHLLDSRKMSLEKAISP